MITPENDSNEILTQLMNVLSSVKLRPVISGRKSSAMAETYSFPPHGNLIGFPLPSRGSCHDQSD